MFKLVVLSALLAAAVAEPQVFYSAPLSPVTYAATIAAPATTSTYVQRSSSYIAPNVYSHIAYPHFIKKRSPQFLNNYVAPYVGAPLVTPYASTYGAPISYTSSVLPAFATPAHFIKKRSTPVITAPAAYITGAPLASTYVASAPLATAYSSGIIPTTSYYSTYPGYVAGLPFIKK